ncbi:MAG: hypothetical protein AAGC44_13090, partial [Planctomycetota bacterium]
GERREQVTGRGELLVGLLQGRLVPRLQGEHVPGDADGKVADLAGDRGESGASVAQRFEIGERTAHRFKRWRRETGSAQCAKTGPKSPIKLAPEDDSRLRDAIEKLWSKVKAWLRRGEAKTFDALSDAVADALRAVTPVECCNYFTSCGWGQK